MYTEKIRIYPDEAQIKAIDQILLGCKELYNDLLDLNIRTYKSTGKGILGYSLDKYAQKLDQKKLPSAIRQNVCKRLNDAFQRFFNKQNRFPKFKSFNKYKSFTYKEYKHGFNFGPNYIKVTGLTKIRAVFTRDFLGAPKTCTIKKLPSGNYYAFIVFDDKGAKKVKVENRKPFVGIDLGVSKFFTDQDGNYISPPRFLAKNLKRLRKAQRELSRKQRGSKNREKARIKVAKLHEKIYNCRRDFHFKVAHYLVCTYDEIYCEDLRIRTMFPGKSKQAKLARRALYDVALYSFLVILDYMCSKYSCTLTKVPPQYTSQMCSNCGTIVKKSLSDRIHACPHCGLTIDRDVNAARNIPQRGKKNHRSRNGGGDIDNMSQLVEVLIPGIHPPKRASKKSGSKLHQ